jgi:hypothetical protein
LVSKGPCPSGALLILGVFEASEFLMGQAEFLWGKEKVLTQRVQRKKHKEHKVLFFYLLAALIR